MLILGESAKIKHFLSWKKGSEAFHPLSACFFTITTHSIVVFLIWNSTIDIKKMVVRTIPFNLVTKLTK